MGSYHCFHQKVIYSGAVSLCRKNGMVLSMPKSRVAMGKIARHCGFSTDQYPDGNLHWVGAKKEPNGNYFHWDDGEVIDTSATIWWPKQPSGDGPCVNNLLGALNDLHCENSTRPTVCQKPA